MNVCFPYTCCQMCMEKILSFVKMKDKRLHNSRNTQKITFVLMTAVFCVMRLCALKLKIAFSKTGKHTKMTLAVILLEYTQLNYPGVCMASSRVEQFYSGECYESNSQVSAVGLSYSECVNECKLRKACVSVHYVRTLRLCTVHVGTVQKVPCVHRGTTFAKKLDWNYVSRR